MTSPNQLPEQPENNDNELFGAIIQMHITGTGKTGEIKSLLGNKEAASLTSDKSTPHS